MKRFLVAVLALMFSQPAFAWRDEAAVLMLDRCEGARVDLMTSGVFGDRKGYVFVVEFSGTDLDGCDPEKTYRRETGYIIEELPQATRGVVVYSGHSHRDPQETITIEDRHEGPRWVVKIQGGSQGTRVYRSKR